ncbi:hypothetical protein QBC47DRAFT_383443 [Echria macrotheca]|uniref:Mid2 domain-containing protein n=1 Tax=Echria macrotheca TaxID=438768 RepID=A0AAJ0BDL6_9PEZI|nr:hypothetical protein QBC47DRAFT_383443 [Echria macrotheca]
MFLAPFLYLVKVSPAGLASSLCLFVSAPDVRLTANTTATKISGRNPTTALQQLAALRRWILLSRTAPMPQKPPKSRLRPLRILSLAAMCATTSATALPAEIFGRQACAAAGFSQCVNIQTAGFCCPQNSTCLTLAGNTTVLCCPSSSNCQLIERISCDVSLQDPSKNPDAKIKTTALQAALPKCQDSCCPFGYTCAGDGNCEKDKDQSTAPRASVTSSTSSPSPTSTSSSSPVKSSTSSISEAGTGLPIQPTPTAGTTTSASENNNGTDSAASSNGPPVAVIGGVTAGAIFAIILAIVVACVLVKRKSKPERSPSLKLTRSSSSFGNIISNPIIVESTTMRSDFNRGPAAGKSAAAAAGLAYRPSPQPGSVSPPSTSSSRNLTANGPRQSSIAFGGPPPYNPTTPPSSRGGNNNTGNEFLNTVPPPPIPRTPPRNQQDHREPSSVSINVFADPFTLTPEGIPRDRERRQSNMTTFTQLMDEADLGGVARGEERFVPSPARTAGVGNTTGSPRR